MRRSSTFSHENPMRERQQQQQQQQQSTGAQKTQEGPLISQISWFWVGAGVIGTTLQTLISLAYVTGAGRAYKTLAQLLLPLVMILYFGSLFAKPRREGHECFLKLHFASFVLIGEVAYLIRNLSQGDFKQAAVHVARGMAELLAFCFLGLSLRQAISKLSSADLNKFLTETLFTGGLKTLASVLFVTFRTTKCMFENQSLSACR